MNREDIYKQTKKDLKEFKILVGKLKLNKLKLEKEELSPEQIKLLKKSIKADEFKIEKIKVSLELLDEIDLKIITYSIFEKIRIKDIAINLNVCLESIHKRKRKAIECIADAMYGHLVEDNINGCCS
ncbi:MAG: hypothetical protein LLF98_12560 [Clostridium sp.]|uniref:hypothetical protein n=1 Tax=Clostridium sp. TaxID=1506 RepID=UPI0025C5532C|nr:hypothetical protein [Clostridium sp.]MCE5222050.1 hypothetical protein [Clostridium sp.]